MPDGDQARRLSYQELSEALGFTANDDRVLVIRETVELLLTPLREQLTVSNERADRAEHRADRERKRADSAARQLASVETELVAAQVEAAGLRCKLAKAASAQPRRGGRGGAECSNGK